MKKIKCFGYREAGLVGIREVRVQRGDAEGAEISAEKTEILLSRVGLDDQRLGVSAAVDG